jgi:hypothetical protein
MVTYCDGQRRWGNARRGRAERCADACAAAEERIRRLRVSEKKRRRSEPPLSRNRHSQMRISRLELIRFVSGSFFTFVSAVGTFIISSESLLSCVSRNLCAPRYANDYLLNEASLVTARYGGGGGGASTGSPGAIVAAAAETMPGDIWPCAPEKKAAGPGPGPAPVAIAAISAAAAAASAGFAAATAASAAATARGS